MGGGEALSTEDQKFYKLSQELDTVSVGVYFPGEANLSLFNGNKLYPILCRKVFKYLKDNGIKYLDEGPAEQGGGGLETLIDILKFFWEHRNVLFLITSIIEHIKSAYKGYLKNTTLPLKPRVCLSFSIEAKSDVSVAHLEYLQYELSAKLSNLLLVADSIATQLNSEHGYLCCDIHVAGTIKSRNFSIRFEIPHEDRIPNNYSRLLKIIKDLRIKSNLWCEYNLTKWFGWYVIRRRDGKLEYEEEGYGMTPLKTYYLPFSSRIVSDYFK